MPGSHDPALEQTESRFHGVCVNVTPNVNALPVLDRSVLVIRAGGALLSRVPHIWPARKRTGN